MALHLLREKAARPAFRDRLEQLVLRDEFCACHRPRRTHTLGTATRRRAAPMHRPRHRGRPGLSGPLYSPPRRPGATDTVPVGAPTTRAFHTGNRTDEGMER